MRTSSHIDRRQVINIRRGLRFAAEIGRAPNLLATLQFGETPCEPEVVSAAFRLLVRNYFTPWLRPRKGRDDYRPAVFAWTVEVAPAGTHVHWLVHVPPILQREFRERLTTWLTRVAGAPWSETAIDVRPADTPEKAGLYLVKGVHPSRAKQLGVRYTSWQGVVSEKRGGISESIGPAAIRAHRKRLAASALRLAS